MAGHLITTKVIILLKAMYFVLATMKFHCLSGLLVMHIDGDIHHVDSWMVQFDKFPIINAHGTEL